MMRWAWVAVGFLAGCGPISPGSHRGDPLFVANARVELDGAGLVEPEGEYRALFVWMFVGGGPFADCLAVESYVSECIQNRELETKFVFQDVEVTPQFPSRLDLSFFDFPRMDEVLTYGDSVLGLGGLVLYDDRNKNGMIDPIYPNPVDEIIAETALNSTVQSSVIFREGDVHPYFDVYRGFLSDCERAPPQGFSVVRIEGQNECTVDFNTELVLRPPDVDRFERLICGESVVERPFADEIVEPREPPPGTCFRCTANNQMMEWWQNEGDFCDRYRPTRMPLKGCPRFVDDPEACWNHRDNPPEWWCPPGSDVKDVCTPVE